MELSPTAVLNHSDQVLPTNNPTSNSSTTIEDVEASLKGLRIDKDIHQPPAQTDENPPDTDPPPNAFQLLPPELTAEIFATVCHADSDKFLSDKQRHNRTTPLVLSHVCTAWRTLIHATPHIWSHVSLCLSSDRLSTQVDLLLEWLIHSGACPLTINLCFENEDNWAGEESVPRELVHLLGSVASRWRLLNVVLPEGWHAFFTDYLDPPEGDTTPLPLLTTLTTQPLWADCGLAPARRKPLTLFRNAPLLTHLHLNGYYLADVSVPWDQLASATLQHVYLDECFYALARSPNINYCRLYTILENDVGREVEEAEVRLAELERIVVYGAWWQDMVRLLRNLRTPKLRSVEVSAPQDAVSIAELGALLQGKMGCTRLKRLSLTDMWVLSEDPPADGDATQGADEVTSDKGVRPSELQSALRSFDALEELVLELHSASAPLNGRFLVDLLSDPSSACPPREGPALLPNLRKLTFSGPLDLSQTSEPVVDLEARPLTPPSPPPPSNFKSVFPSPPPSTTTFAPDPTPPTHQPTLFYETLLAALDFRTDFQALVDGRLNDTMEAFDLRTPGEGVSDEWRGGEYKERVDRLVGRGLELGVVFGGSG